ncbi:MAG: hypothetical protein ACK41O_26925, partial [Runella zeae]
VWTSLSLSLSTLFVPVAVCSSRRCVILFFAGFFLCFPSVLLHTHTRVCVFTLCFCYLPTVLVSVLLML